MTPYHTPKRPRLGFSQEALKYRAREIARMGAPSSAYRAGRNHELAVCAHTRMSELSILAELAFGPEFVDSLVQEYADALTKAS